MTEGNNVTESTGGNEQTSTAEQSSANVNESTSTAPVDVFASSRAALSGMGGEGSVYDTSNEHQKSFLPKFDQSTEATTEASTAEAPSSTESSTSDNTATNTENQNANQQSQEQTQASEASSTGDAATEQQNSNDSTATTTEGNSELSFESEITGKHSFGTQEKEGDKGNENKSVQSYETFEALDSTLNSLDEGLSVSTLAAKIPEYVEAKKNYDSVVVEKTNLEAVLKNMPAPLFDAVKAWHQKEDWREVVNTSPRFDFQKEFKDQNQAKITDHFYPGKITPEEWKDFNGESPDEAIAEKVNGYKEMAEENFILSKSKFDQEQVRMDHDVNQAAERLNGSYSKSKESMGTLFEGTNLPVTEAFSNRVDETAKSRESILGIFFNADGSYKEDAHQRVAMALGGKGLVVNQGKALEKRMITQARKEVIRTAPNESNVSTGDKGSLTESQQSAQKIKEAVGGILYETEKSPYE